MPVNSGATGYPGVDAADLAIAATVVRLDAQLLTRNVTHVPDVRRAHCAVLNRPAAPTVHAERSATVNPRPPELHASPSRLA